MNPQKNHRFLIDCFHKIAQQRHDAMLLLLGDGELRQEITQQIARLGLEKGVLLLGVRKNVEDYFCAMDCLVLPSLHEGLPVVIVEAQAGGLRCLVSDTVTREVQVSELVSYLPIDQGEEPWATAVLSCDTRHMDVTKQIEDSGFSVEASSKWLCDFYLKLAEEGEK
jgi:glycosyltransferase involved in cell wall biosynthesis